MSGDLQKAEYRTNPNYLIRKVMDQYLLVAVGSTEVMQNKLMTLNETGRFIWDNLQDFLTLEELTDRAKKQFIDKDGTLEQEICDFVKVLVKLTCCANLFRCICKLRKGKNPLLLLVGRLSAKR